MKSKENFLDKNTLISVVLIFAAWFSWDSYMKKKYPLKNRINNVSSQDLKQNNKSDNSNLSNQPSINSQSDLKQKIKNHKLVIKKEHIFSYKNKNLSFDISSKGMGLKNIKLNHILDRTGKVISLFSGDKDLPFETRLVGLEYLELDFRIKKISDYSWEGVAVWDEVKIKKNISIKPSQFIINTTIQVTGQLNRVKGISTLLTHSLKTENLEKNFLSVFTPPDIFSVFVSTSKGFEHIPIEEQDSSYIQELKSQVPFSAVRVVGLGTKYFGQAWIEDKSDVFPQFQFRFLNQTNIGVVQHSIVNFQKDFDISYKIFLGPKDFSLFTKSYSVLISWIDFGWFGVLSRFILQILQFFYSLVGNWGVSIILLTFLVRIVLLPFVLSSHRSMEVMKKIHPEIQKIRAKFKDNPQRMNQEVMAIMKNHRANPLGGCLPLLLQVPVFWSLWRALSNSYSLYQAPFVFWIQDLSWKDPYYILPILMGFFMFIQQKLTPVTMSKEMARAMQIMPVFMSVFMVNLPSGLVLYMLISSLFGLAQQIFLNKNGLANSELIKPVVTIKE